MAVLCGTYVSVQRWLFTTHVNIVTASCKATGLFVIPSNNAEAVAALLEAGADVNGTVDENGLTLLMRAVTFGNPHIVRKLATYPGVRLDAQVSGTDLQ